MMASVAVSNMVKPAMNRDPSGATEITLDAPEIVRLRSTTPDATSYTKMYVVAAVGVITPMMKLPSGVRSRRPVNVRVGRVNVVGGSGAGAVGRAGTVTSSSC